jgi:hypothetical protein
MEGGAGPGQDPRGAEAPRLQGVGIPDKPEWFQKGMAVLHLTIVSIYLFYSFSLSSVPSGRGMNVVSPAMYALIPYKSPRTVERLDLRLHQT